MPIASPLTISSTPKALALFITFVFAAIAVLSLRFKLQFHLSGAYLWKLLKQSAPFALLGILMTLYYRLDGYMIERMLGVEGPRQAGVYAASYRLFDAANMIPYLFSTLLLPMFSRMLAKQEDAGPLAVLSGRCSFVFSALVSVICFVWSEWWMKLCITGPMKSGIVSSDS
jgi:O-antigen/teichoic acid export membrane protein